MYGARAQGSGELLGRIARVAAAAFGDVPRRGVIGLGDDWSDYLRNGFGPPGGRITSPNGDVVVFDANGTPDYTIPATRTDSTINKDPNSPFFGWTLQEMNAFYAAQGETGMSTDATRAAETYKPGALVATVDPATQAASDEALRQFARSNPKVIAALAKLKTGSFHTTAYDTSDAQTKEANEAQLLRDAKALLQTLINDGELFTDTLKPGVAYPDSTLRGMISTAEWLEDYLSVAHGGKPLHALAAAGRLPPGVLVASANVVTTTAPAAIVIPDDLEATTSSGDTTSASSTALLPVPSFVATTFAPATTRASDTAPPATPILGATDFGELLRRAATSPFTLVAAAVILASRGRGRGRRRRRGRR
jgi:hypothetical protein